MSTNQTPPLNRFNAAINTDKNNCTNNGGNTDYYALPPESDEPTLNDLIEYKNMPFWQGEAFKALYALEGRANRSNDSSSSEVRELNKVIYYCKRRLAMLDKEDKKG